MDRDAGEGPARPCSCIWKQKGGFGGTRMEVTGDHRRGPGVEGVGPVDVLRRSCRLLKQ